MGIMTLYKTSRPDSSLFSGITVSFGLPYFTISVALNVLLTIIIAWRLLLHNRELRRATGSSSGISQIYKSIITMLIESSALYATVSICFIIPYSISSYTSAVFLSMLSRVQIIAPLLIIRRVATQRAFTASNMAGAVSSEQSAARFKSTGEADTPNYALSPIVDSKRNRSDVTTTIDFAGDMDEDRVLQYEQKA